MSIDELLRETVHDLAAQAGPADLAARAIRTGRRRRRERRAGIAVTVVVALAAAVVVPLQVLGGGWSRAADGDFVGTLKDTGDAMAVAFSPDGSIVAVAGGNDHDVHLFNARTGRRLRDLKGQSVVNDVAFSPDGTRVVTGGGDIFAVATGARLVGLATGGYGVAFSPDGTLVATANGFLPNGVELYDASTGERVREITQDYSNGVAFSPDGTLLATSIHAAVTMTVPVGTTDGIVLWRLDTGASVATLAAQPGLELVGFSPDGSLLATDNGSAVQLWDPVTGTRARDLAAARGLGFSPDGTTFAGAAANGQVSLFDPATGTLERNLDGVIAQRFAFAADGLRAAIVDPNRNVKLISLFAGGTSVSAAPGVYFTGDLGRAGDGVGAVAISPDGTILAAAGGNTHSITLWNAGTGVQSGIITGDSVTSALAFTPDSSKLVTNAAIYDAHTGAKLVDLGYGEDVAVSPDGTMVAVTHSDLPDAEGAVTLVDASTGAVLRTIDGAAYAVAFSPDGTLLAATSGTDLSISVWRVATGERVASFPGPVLRLQFSPDGTMLAVSGFKDDGGVIGLWNPLTGEHVRDLAAPVGLAFSPDGTVFAGTDADGVVRLLDPTSGTVERTLAGVHANAVAFSPDGTRLLVANVDDTASVLAL